VYKKVLYTHTHKSIRMNAHVSSTNRYSDIYIYYERERERRKTGNTRRRYREGDQIYRMYDCTKKKKKRRREKCTGERACMCVYIHTKATNALIRVRSLLEISHIEIYI